MTQPESLRARRAAKLREKRRQAGLRLLRLWLPDSSDASYRARIEKQCRRLRRLTPDEAGMAAAFEQEAANTPGWR